MLGAGVVIMAAMPEVQLLDVKKEADAGLRVAWERKDLPEMLKHLSKDQGDGGLFLGLSGMIVVGRIARFGWGCVCVCAVRRCLILNS